MWKARAFLVSTFVRDRLFRPVTLLHMIVFIREIAFIIVHGIADLDHSTCSHTGLHHQITFSPRRVSLHKTARNRALHTCSGSYDDCVLGCTEYTLR